MRNVLCKSWNWYMLYHSLYRLLVFWYTRWSIGGYCSWGESGRLKMRYFLNDNTGPVSGVRKLKLTFSKPFDCRLTETIWSCLYNMSAWTAWKTFLPGSLYSLGAMRNVLVCWAVEVEVTLRLMASQPSWCRAHSGTCDQTLLPVGRLLSESCGLVFVGRPL
jgi:hypothetical protein